MTGNTNATRALSAFAGLVSCLATVHCRPNSDPTETTETAASVEVLEVDGVDTSVLTPRERREWSAQLGELLAPCENTPVTVAVCIKEKRDCAACVPAAEFLRRQVQAGRPKKDRAEAFASRFDPKEIKTLALDGSPVFGPEDAPITVAEWADFECPFCRMVSPLLDELVERFPGQVRVVFKFYPLKSHPNGEIAARAGVAAHNQGKFWEMHHAMFENQGRLARSDLEQLAAELELDMAKFKKDLTSAETTARIESDQKQADQLGLEGTPMMFINGREVNLEQLNNPKTDLEDWIVLDLTLMGKEPAKPKPGSEKAPGVAPSASADAPPAASASAGPAPSGPKR
jgi:protein-disulfide isomerase